VREWGGGVVGSSSLSGEGDGRVIVVGGVTLRVGMRKGSSRR
jgi:hypothetical protein